MVITKEDAALVEARVGYKIQPGTRFASDMDRRILETWTDPMAAEWKPGLCRVCGHTVAAADPGPDPADCYGLDLTVTVCPDCAPVVNRHYATAEEGRPEDQTPIWNRVCPPRYREAVENEPLPFKHSQAFREIADFSPVGGTGLIITGDSGAGKTVALWTLARNLELRGIPFLLVTAVELTRRLARSAKELQANRELLTTPVLIIDDLGKERISPGAAAVFWELVEDRVAWRRSICVSTRFRGKAFEERFAEPEMGQDIRGRLIECCDVVQFRVEKETETRKSA